MYIETIERLIDRLIKLPGIGRRSAERIVNHILSESVDDARELAQAISDLKENVRFCKVCHNLCEQELCSFCNDARRNRGLVCIVEKPSDVGLIERTGMFTGLYHVLKGSIAPLDGTGPADLEIDSLIARLKEDVIKEVIIATDADTEGEATALYLTKLIKPLNVSVSRIGLGLPVGSNIEYADTATLSKALESRRQL